MSPWFCKNVSIFWGEKDERKSTFLLSTSRALMPPSRLVLSTSSWPKSPRSPFKKSKKQNQITYSPFSSNKPPRQNHRQKWIIHQTGKVITIGSGFCVSKEIVDMHKRCVWSCINKSLWSKLAKINAREWSSQPFQWEGFWKYWNNKTGFRMGWFFIHCQKEEMWKSHVNSWNTSCSSNASNCVDSW